MPGAWGQIPFFFKLHGVLLAGVVLVTSVVSSIYGPHGVERVAFAIPAAEHPIRTWQSEVDDYGQRVSQAFGVRRETANEFASWILEASMRHHLEPDLLASLVHTESTFRKQAVSSVGAVGPAQVRPHFWSAFCGSSDLLDPAENIYCGAQVLSHLRDRCGDEVCALEAYNIGIYSQREQAARRYVAKIDWARNQLHNLSL